MRQIILLLIFLIFILLGIYDGYSKIDLDEYENLNSILKVDFKAGFTNEISESSGLIYTDGKLWTHNDKGGKPCIYCIDTTTGKIVQTVCIDNFTNIDWEDITADVENIYVGDFGNNYGLRKDLRILVIPKSGIGSERFTHVKASAINFNYLDQHDFRRNTKNNFDCESIVSIDDSLYLFSKDRGDGFTKVYVLSKMLFHQSVSPKAVFDSKGRICGSTFNSQKHELILVGYMPGTTKSFIWRFDSFHGTNFFEGKSERYDINPEIAHWKTEGITFENENRIFISCETTNDQKAALFTLSLN